MLAHLLSSKAAASLIDEVWAWEAIQHGDSALVNATSASGVCKFPPLYLSDFLSYLETQVDWTDNARDILNFLVNFLPSSAGNKDDDASPLPTHLPRISSQEAQARLKGGFRSRRIVVIGHSMGGCTSYVWSLPIFLIIDFLYVRALAACVSPALFTALILVDPVIIGPTDMVQQQKSNRLATAALGRRESWSSRYVLSFSYQLCLCSLRFIICL